MLQKYDKTKYLSVLAFAVLGGATSANAVSVPSDVSVCAPANGFDASLSAFHAEATTCLNEAPSTIESDVAAGAAALSERHRVRFGLEPLSVRSSMDATARLIAMEFAAMGARAAAANENLSHIDRLRMVDRTGIYGASGINIAVLPEGATAADAYNALLAEPVNAENMLRDVFSHTGLGAVETPTGEIILVQLFAQLDGELEHPVPLMLDAPMSIKAHLTDVQFEQMGWRLQTGNRVVRRSAGDMLRAPLIGSGTAMIEIEASHGTSTYRLKGPAVAYR